MGVGDELEMFLLLHRDHGRLTPGVWGRPTLNGHRLEAAILRAYLKEWAREVNQFFGGVRADAPDADLARIAPKHSVFRVVPYPN